MSTKEIATLRMSHQVETMAENQKSFINMFKNNNNVFKLPQATPQITKGNNSRMILFNNIFREALEEKFTAESCLEHGLDFYVKRMPKEVFKLYGSYIFLFV
jgi:pantothenate kinase